MIESRMPSESAADDGFFAHSRALISSLASYFQARLELAGIESKEAAIHYLTIVALAVGALVAVVLGYLFLCLAVVFLVARLFDDPHAWMWIMLGVALLHFAGVGACGYFAWLKLSKPMFASTLAEFKKDQLWLNKPNVNAS